VPHLAGRQARVAFSELTPANAGAPRSHVCGWAWARDPLVDSGMTVGAGKAVEVTTVR